MNSYAKEHLRGADYLKRSENALREATKFFRTLDRSRLGIFAVSDEMLIKGIAYNIRGICKHNCSNNADEYMRVTHLFDGYANVINIFEPETAQAAMAEAMYWGFHCYFGGIQIERMRDRLQVVSRHPVEFHDYFRAGIWDVKEIEGFLAHGIDSEMGLRTIRGETP